MGDGNGVDALLLGFKRFRVLSPLDEDGDLFILMRRRVSWWAAPSAGCWRGATAAMSWAIMPSLFHAVSLSTILPFLPRK